ncbi:MAG: DUF2207 domain-containing protein [Clostridiales bacterium]|nr:DUF2207 domain-containing protein [Clostridiales bacterium]
MNSQKRSTVVFGILFATAVLFFIGIFIFVSVFYDGDYVQTIDDAMVINKMRVDVDWSKDRSCKIKQEISVEFVEPRHGICVDIPVNSGERVRNLKVIATDNRGFRVQYEIMHEAGNKIVRIKVGDPDYYFDEGERLACTLKYDYITPEHPDGKDILDINALGSGWACAIKSATVSVTFPTAVQNNAVSVWVGEKNVAASLTNEGKTVVLETGNLNPFTGVRVKAKMPVGTLTDSGFEGVITIVIGVMLVAAAVLMMVFLGKDKPLTPVVSFYPPMTDGKTGIKRRMLPVQLGKIIDGTCSSSDVTSLIFYWASEGYIAIDEQDDDTYLVKLKDIDPVTEYERNMFNSLFKNSKSPKEHENKRIGVKELSGDFATHITNVKEAVNDEFSGKFYKKGYTALSIFMAVAAALFAVLGSVLCTLRIAGGFFNLLGVITVIPVALASALGSMLVTTYFKLGEVRSKVFLVLFFIVAILLTVAVMFIVPTDAMGWTEKVIFAVCIGATSALAPFLTRRKDGYTEQLNDVIGFRNFLRDAQKDELETLLKDDPQYYYNILPYANVLGVSDIWQNKFADLTIEPPTYYSGRDISLFDIYVLSRMSDSVGKSLSYVPPKASIGSFSGGGHGGGGGGGFGGGGGGSW